MTDSNSTEFIDVAAAVFIQDGSVLVARRAPGQHLESKWEFPGGKVEENETPEECLLRELDEELGVKVEVGDYLGKSDFSYPNKNVRLLAYYVSFWSGDFFLSVHDKIAWIHISDLLNVDLAAADIPIAIILRDQALLRGSS